ncbi:sushi, von Willebrand factor type A, EGF and pentraxin domain-containing protein 1-like isoform X2 [Halichondria panicea]|uniref:sushi, von Willebrand factor type A, EGF and pentraxin domain-containing protein 1-like isoform X2 n=1 Tax=Halichondria panicea TaxID=6063 RepID=UPI00312BAEF1
MAYYMNQARALLIFFLWDCIVEGQPYCFTPPTVENGYVFSRTSTRATYRCNSGYSLSGSGRASCVDGCCDWISVPTCEAVVINCDTAPSISNGSPGTPTSTTYRGTVTYSCNIGYQRSGPSTVTCQASGSWSTRPSCNAVSCGNPPTVPNGLRRFTGTTFGETATYSCNTGYQLSGSATVTCQASRNWSARPSCTPVSCGNPPTIPNGIRTFTGTIFRGIATYSCNTGYQRSGSSTVICQASRSWSTRPTCNTDQPGSCGDPPTIPNGSMTFIGTTTGETATYTCNTGYQLLGAATVTCEASETWATRPICDAVSCGSPPFISNGSPGTPTRTTFEGTATYTCDTGYQLSGSATVTCEASGSWSVRPSCNADQPGSCSDPPTIPNGSRTFTGTTTGETATYTCNTGYQLPGSAIVTCEASGIWTTRPICNAVSCGFPPSISNGSPGIPTRTTFGGTVTYTCDTGAGYQLLGSAIVTCDASGIWTTRPICDAVSCGFPPSISNGSPGTPTRTTFGGTVTYTCDTGAGYQLLGSATVTCEASGSWSVRPSCNDTTDFTTIIVGAAMATVIVLLIVVVFVVVIAFKNYRSKFRYSIKKNSTVNNVTTITEETIMTNIPLNGIPRSMMSLPSLPAEYEEPDMTVESKYDEIWSSENGDNEHIFALGPCSAYK